MVKQFKSYLSLVKFSHTLFAMPFAFIGYYLALDNKQHEFDWKTLALVVLCMVIARNAAMAFNRFLDKEIDKKNPRTAQREIPKGIIKPKSALVFVIINVLLFFATTWFINLLTFLLAPAAIFVILFYSYTKRFTPLCHFVLGLGLSLAPIGAFLAVTGKFEWLPIIFSFVVLLWVSGFDMIYALQDQEFDKKYQLKSIPALIGNKNALTLSTIIHIICAVLIILAGFLGHFQLFYWIGSTAFILLLFYQHLIVKPDKLDKVNLAFFSANGIASVFFAVLFVLDYYFPVEIW